MADISRHSVFEAEKNSVVMLLRLECPSFVVVTNSGGQISACRPSDVRMRMIGHDSIVHDDMTDP